MENNLKIRLAEFLAYLGVGQAKFAESVGLSRGFANNIGDSIRKDNLNKIISIYPELNTNWLITGEGKMLKQQVGDVSNNGSGNVSIVNANNGYINFNGTSKNETHSNNRTPYYDVDFEGGFDLMENDQTQNPSGYIDLPQYNKADYWVNITGNSMQPLINHGDMIAIRKVEDWETYLLFGEVYGIVTDEYRTVKRVRKSEKGDDFLCLVPENEEYDKQDISKSIVRGMFQILGCAKRIF